MKLVTVNVLGMAPDPEPASGDGVETSATLEGIGVAVGTVGVGAAEEAGAEEAAGGADDAGAGAGEVPEPPAILKSMQDS